MCPVRFVTYVSGRSTIDSVGITPSIPAAPRRSRFLTVPNRRAHPGEIGGEGGIFQRMDLSVGDRHRPVACDAGGASKRRILTLRAASFSLATPKRRTSGLLAEARAKVSNMDQ
jgi:hypothetical protein